MLPEGSTAICGKIESPVLFEMFFGVENTCAWATSADVVRTSRPASAAHLMNLSKQVFARLMAHLRTYVSPRSRAVRVSEFLNTGPHEFGFGIVLLRGVGRESAPVFCGSPAYFE